MFHHEERSDEWWNFDQTQPPNALSRAFHHAIQFNIFIKLKPVFYTQIQFIPPPPCLVCGLARVPIATWAKGSSFRLIGNLDSGRVDKVSDIPRLSTSEKAGAGGVVAESGRMVFCPQLCWKTLHCYTWFMWCTILIGASDIFSRETGRINL